MTPKEIAIELFDLDIIVEELIWLGGTMSKPSSELSELITEDPERIIELLNLDADSLDLDADEEIYDAITESRKLGFLVKLGSPCKDFANPDDPDSSYTSSWGHYHTVWLYTEELPSDDFLKQAKDWRESMDRETRKRQKMELAGPWKSFAEWPKELGLDPSEDTHPTHNAAQAVLVKLRNEGLGGEGKVFPVRAWIEPA